MKDIISKFAIILLLSLGTLGPAAQNVSQQWVKTYSYQGNGTNQVTAITTDGNSNIFVSGASTSSNGYDFCTIKYLPNGTQHWAARYSGFEGQYNDDFVYASTRDYNNFIYVTGGSRNGGFSERDIATIKYNQNGDEVWVRRFAATGLIDDVAFGIFVDNSSNVYVCGSSGDNLIVIKYNSAGTELWKTIINDPQGYESVGYQIMADPNGTIYAAGRRMLISSSNGEGKALLIKLSNTGVLQWERTFEDGPVNYFWKMKRDVQGNIVVGGMCGAQQTHDIIVRKYAPDGENIWSKKYNGSSNNFDYLSDMVIDYNNNIYIAGTTNNNKLTAIKYSSTGEELWVKSYLHPGSLSSQGEALTFDGQGSIFVTGSSKVEDNPVKYDILTVKFNTAGELQWANNYTTAQANSEQGKRIVLDNSNNVIVAGNLISQNGTSYCTIKYSPVSGIEIIGGEIPQKFSLSQNYPNPFNPVTNINFSLPKNAEVKLVVYDILGRIVKELVNEQLQAGTYKFDFDASQLSSGTYFYKLTAGDFSEIKKMTLVK